MTLASIRIGIGSQSQHRGHQNRGRQYAGPTGMANDKIAAAKHGATQRGGAAKLHAHTNKLFLPSDSADFVWPVHAHTHTHVCVHVQ